jgi:hypothetical protein
VEHYLGPLIVWTGVIGTEGLPSMILAVRRHEPGVPRACIGHRLMSKAHAVTTAWCGSFISTTGFRCNHVVLPSTLVHYNLIYNYKLCVRPCVRPTTFWERFLWRNRPQRFSMAEPATETMTTGYQRPRSWDSDPETQVLRAKCSSPRPQNGQNY